MADGLVWEERPDLRDPLLVAAFEGWNDAGDAATGPPTGWCATPRRRTPSRSRPSTPTSTSTTRPRRPQVELVDGVAAAVHWPAHDCFAVGVARPRPRGAARHRAQRAVAVVLRRGDRPSPARPAARRSSPSARCSATCPTPRPVRVTGTVDRPRPRRRSSSSHRSRYEGPTGIVGVLHDRVPRDRPAVGVALGAGAALRGHAPEPARHPGAARALRLARRAAARARTASTSSSTSGSAQVDHAIRDNDEVTHLRARARGAASTPTTPSELGVVLGGTGRRCPSADELVGEVEQFLREQDGGIR